MVRQCCECHRIRELHPGSPRCENCWRQTWAYEQTMGVKHPRKRLPMPRFETLEGALAFQQAHETIRHMDRVDCFRGGFKGVMRHARH